MYTIAKVAEPWAKLFPKITENATNIEVTVRGQSFKIEIPKRRSQVVNQKKISYKS
ncbi:hypothetical protein LC605_27820 [Nostoc sp. CHAB 5836]|uniref:hypothetical protein n=1 Tax=Nostoc sp. CHAB 5836 TaxID=2780404 RepID=UPI001E4D8349|nr:hypothetical protein [Nostoc sp. CHAB 5836]MCC5618828.1 hypothetical protein [Nostoc sp. CHAB 5836]